MSAYLVRLPDVGEGVAEAEIIAWHVAVGDEIGEDDAIVEVMTDKATVELPSPVAGTVTRLGADVGDVVAVGSDLVWIEIQGRIDDGAEDSAAPSTQEVSAGGGAEASSSDGPSVPSDRADEARGDEAHAGEARAGEAPLGGRALAAPAVRKRARALGVDLTDVAGTGPDGRVEHDDLDALITRRPPTGPVSAVAQVSAVPSVPAVAGAGDDVVDAVKIVGLRRNIAARMQEAYRRIPHFTYVDDIDVTEVERLRAELNRAHADDRPKLTMLPFLMRAVVVAVGSYPQMNARFRDDEGVLDRHSAVHLGVAVQTPKGLMVPVVEHAEGRDVWNCAAEVARLSEAARAGTVLLSELSGSTITITSLGALGGIASTPIINAPEVAIIGVNKIVERPVFADGSWRPRQAMNLSSSFDHRVIDGFDAAQFIQRIKALLETPALLFVSPT